MLTADKNMRFQQNLEGRKLSIVILNSRLIKWESILPLAPQVQRALDKGLAKGVFLTIDPE